MVFDVKRSAWLCNTLKAEKLTHIVDVGANPVEPAPYQDLLNAGGCQLTGFEPQDEAFAKLQNIKGPLETYHKFAVGAGNVKSLNIMGHDSMTSFFKGDAKSTRFLQRFVGALKTVKTIRFQTMALDKCEAVPPFDLLKIDIQGGEIEVFNGAAHKLKSAIAVIPEVRFYQLYLGEPMMSGVDADLRARGFALHKFMFCKGLALPNSQYNRLKPKRHSNQLIDGDAVYIRDLKTPETYSDDDLKHLAILADAVWFSFDLVIRVLDMLVSRGALDPQAPSKYVDHLPQDLRQDSVS